MPDESVPAPLMHRQTIMNRVRPFMVHCDHYCDDGQKRLARDCKVSPSTISRLIRGESQPSYQLAAAVTRAIAYRLGVPSIDMREIFTTDFTYPTSCVCDITPHCRGCQPP